MRAGVGEAEEPATFDTFLEPFHLQFSQTCLKIPGNFFSLVTANCLRRRMTSYWQTFVKYCSGYEAAVVAGNETGPLEASLLLLLLTLFRC